MSIFTAPKDRNAYLHHCYTKKVRLTPFYLSIYLSYICLPYLSNLYLSYLSNPSKLSI